jgi:AcrR family transcriptional regulator
MDITEDEIRRRRRGAALETAILDAAWVELAEVGYAQISMEGVAARAGTSKQVLYRRWKNRAELLLAAMRHRVGSVSEDPPDTGTLRGDVLVLLAVLTQRYQDFGPDLVHGIMSEVHDVRADFHQTVEVAMTAILKRAEERGEVRPGVIPSRIVTLPADLIRNELLLMVRPVTEQTRIEIVDEIFLPLVAPPGSVR